MKWLTSVSLVWWHLAVAVAQDGENATTSTTTEDIRDTNNTWARSSRIDVHIPFDIHDHNGYEHLQALFGLTSKQHVGSMAAYVYYLNTSLCHENIVLHTDGSMVGPTAPTQIFPPPTLDDGKKLFDRFILLADDDDTCSYVSMARHAQQLGASGLVVGATQCQCHDKHCLNNTKSTTNGTLSVDDDPPCLAENPVVVNDGSGHDISIPVFWLVKTASDNIKQQVVDHSQPVLIELTWGIPHAKQVSQHLDLKYHLWTTTNDELLDIETYQNLKTVYQSIGTEAAHFEPRYAVLDGRRWHCRRSNAANASSGEGPCDHLCSNHGRYCTLHGKDLSGYAILKETVRRLCIWNLYHKNSDDPRKDAWWTYTVYHKQHCSEPHMFASSECLDNALAAANVDAHAVDTCMAESGDMDTDVTNTLLEDMRDKFARSGVVSLPAITVDHQVLEHTSSYSLFDTICWKYWNAKNIPSVPQICIQCGSCPNKIGCLEQGGKCVDFNNDERHADDEEHKKERPDKKQDTGGKKHGFLWHAFWFLSLCGLAFGGWYYYKEHYGGDTFSNRRPTMNQYLQLTGDGD